MDRLNMFVKIHYCFSFKITILKNKFKSIIYVETVHDGKGELSDMNLNHNSHNYV